ncbi:MAG: hypothetical protein NT069_08045 [Planctomycetota bacterium]|nr:hypothetical protein [Planctomycetota bacterium]
MIPHRSRGALVVGLIALCGSSGCIALSFGSKEIHEVDATLEQRIESLEARVQMLESGTQVLGTVPPELK